MFAGPNGSGKSSLNLVLPDKLKGVYLNPDELEKQLKKRPVLELGPFNLSGKASALWEIASQSSIHAKRSAPLIAEATSPDDLTFDHTQVDSYLCSSLIEGMRKLLLDAGVSFTFETVMSHPSKVEFLQQARERGYRTYLYFIATEDPQINVSRVANRVKKGGHPVPESKIRSRYYRSLALLYDAIKSSDRAYLFDNSSDGSDHVWIAEATDGRKLTLEAEETPHWFHKFVVEKLSSP